MRNRSTHARVVAIRLAETASRPHSLTPREWEVLALLARRWTDAEIAVNLRIGPRSVNHHVRRTLSRLGAGNRQEAVVIA